MKLRIIEYDGQLYVSTGITNLRDKYHNLNEHWECFECHLLVDGKSMMESILMGHSIFIKFEDAKEVTDRNRLEAIMILYG